MEYFSNSRGEEEGLDGCGAGKEKPGGQKGREKEEEAAGGVEGMWPNGQSDGRRRRRRRQGSGERTK